MSKTINKEQFMEVEKYLEYWTLYDIECLVETIEGNGDEYDVFWDMANALTPIYTHHIYEEVVRNYSDIDDAIEEIGYSEDRSLSENMMSALCYIYREGIAKEYYEYIEDLIEDVEEN